MDVNILELLGLAELFEENDKILEVADILDNVTLPPMYNPWVASPPVTVREEPPAIRRRSLRRDLALAGNILVYLLCAAVIAVSLILKFSGYNDSILGYHIYHVDSGSMTPTPQADGTIPKGGFRVNDAIIVKNTAAEQVKPGDIITFWQNDEHQGYPITHRVLDAQILSDRSILFVTKGDHNDGPDPEPIPGGRVIGVKVLRLARLGGVLKGAQAHPWITVGISAGVMAVVFIAYIVTAKRAGKREE